MPPDANVLAAQKCMWYKSRMKLREWLRAHDIKPVAFAAQVGRSPSTISRLLRGLTRPDWETMTAIEHATNGAVTPNDWKGLPADPQPRQQPASAPSPAPRTSARKRAAA